MKLKRLFQLFLSLTLALGVVNFAAPASQADTPAPMGLFVSHYESLGQGINSTYIVTTHFAENKVNESNFSLSGLEYSNDYQTGLGPVAVSLDSDWRIYTANFGDSTVTKVVTDNESNEYGSCSVKTEQDGVGLNPISIATYKGQDLAYKGSVLTANIGDNSMSILYLGTACQTLFRRAIGWSAGQVGPIAVADIENGSFYSLDSLARTITLWDPYIWSPTLVLNLTLLDWFGKVDPTAILTPTAMQKLYDLSGNSVGVAVLFDEIVSGARVKQHVWVTTAMGTPQYFGPFDTPNWSMPNSQRFVVTSNGFCLITSSTTIECLVAYGGGSSTVITTNPGIAALTTDEYGNLYAANSIDKTVTMYKATNNWAQQTVFQISLTQPIVSSIQENNLSVPSAPISVVAKTIGKRSATVNFATPASNGGSAVTSYTATSSQGEITKTLTQSNGGNFTFDNLQPGTSYTFAVTATNEIGTSVATVSNSIKTIPLEVSSISSLSFVDDGTGTAGKIIWSGKTIDSVLYTGPENSYPGPYNYGAFSSGWNGTIRNLEPGKPYTISIFAISADGVGETKSLTFLTSAALPVLVGAASATTVSYTQTSATKLSQLLKWIDENTFVPGEGANMSNLLTKFDALETSAYRSYIKVPTSRVSKVDVKSLTPKACTVVSASAKVDAGLVTAQSSDKCTISYTVTGASRAPVTLVKDFAFKKYVN